MFLFFSDCLEFFLEFLQTSVGHNNVIPIEVFDVRPHRKSIYLIFVSVGVLPTDFARICS